MLEQALEALKTYDWAPGLKDLKPIDEAIVTATGDDRAKLETQLIAALRSDVSRAAKDFICRKLMVIGTAASVPALSELLTKEDHAHMARYALERVPGPEAAQALCDALSKTDGELKIGVISSLGKRPDANCVSALAGLLNSGDEATTRAAALALGAQRTADAAKALQAAKASPAVTDAKLACAEAMLAGGNKAQALLLYKGLATGDQPKHVKLAATRGMLACAGKQE